MPHRSRKAAREAKYAQPKPPPPQGLPVLAITPEGTFPAVLTPEDVIVPLERPRRRSQGQAIVEMALLMPVVLSLILGGMDVGLLQWLVSRGQNGAATMAALVAQDDATTTQLADVADLAGCRHPDWDIGGAWPQVTLTLRCDYRSLSTLLPNGYQVRATAVRPAPAATPMPAATPIPPEATP